MNRGSVSFVIDQNATLWFVIASIQVFCACYQLSALRRILTQPSQYPGSIECALYLVYEPVMDDFGCHNTRPIWNAVGGRDEAGGWDILFIWFCGFLTLAVPCSWASNLYT